jgi:hypothetical protein
MPRAFIVALWQVEDPTMGTYIATTGVPLYAPAAGEKNGQVPFVSMTRA